MKSACLKWLPRLCLTLVFLAASPQICKADDMPGFFSALSDIPQMEGLIELEDQTLAFDKPGGRFVEIIAISETQPEEAVLGYYQQSLPQLGWHPVDEASYIRENEQLTIVFERLDGQNFVRFILSPKGLQE